MSAGLALVVLAAGESRRLRTCKALVDLGGRTPLARLLEAGACVGTRPLVVAGAEVSAIRAAAPSDVEVVVNERVALGRTESVRVARKHRSGFDLVVAPVDVPLVSAEVFAALAAEWERAGAPARGWLAPMRVEAQHGEARERGGHPVVIGRELLAELDGLAPGASLRELRRLALPRWWIAVLDAAILDDLDTPDDLKRLRGRLVDGG